MKDGQKSFIANATASALSALRDVWPIWLTLSALTSIPYVVAALRTPDGFSFSAVLTAYDDTFTYFAWMRQAADGHLLMCDLFTTELQVCNLFLPLWAFLGVISRVSHVPIPVVFHAARLISGLVLLIVARGLAFGVTESAPRARYALWLYALSGGLGWLVYILRPAALASGIQGSADLNLPEAFAFRSVFAQVHFAVGVALMSSAIKLFYDALSARKINRALLGGLLLSLLAVVYPYAVLVVLAVAAAVLMTWPFARARPHTGDLGIIFRVRTAAAFCATAIPGVAYLVYLNRSSEVAREWLQITDTLSPPPWEYILGFGVVGILAVFGFRSMLMNHARYGRLLLIWAIVQAALLYAPVNFQRRLVEGLQLPLCIAASVALFSIASRLFEARFAFHRNLFLGGVVVFASITNLGFVAALLIPAGSGAVSEPRRYTPEDLITAFEWVRANAAPGDAVFSSYLTGNLVPSMTGLPVFLGHYGQTIKSDDKGRQVTALYSNAMPDGAARELFKKHRVRFVVYGPFERAENESFDPPEWLELKYSNNTVDVFTVGDSATIKR